MADANQRIHTIVQKIGVSKKKKLKLLFSNNDALNWSKVTVKTFINSTK